MVPNVSSECEGVALCADVECRRQGGTPGCGREMGVPEHRNSASMRLGDFASVRELPAVSAHHVVNVLIELHPPLVLTALWMWNLGLRIYAG